MAFKVKKSYSQKEIDLLYKRSKGRPSFSSVAREGTRYAFKVPEDVRKVGEKVYYNEQIGKVKKVTNKGIIIDLYDCKDGLLGTCHRKDVFVSNKEILDGKVYPMAIREQPVFFAGVPVVAKV